MRSPSGSSFAHKATYRFTAVLALKIRLKDIYLGLRRLVLGCLPKPKPPPGGGRKMSAILVISLQRLGDVALEIPALCLLRQAYPESTLGIVAPVAYHPLFQVACRPQHFFEFPANRDSRRSVLSKIRKHHWDLVIDYTIDYHLGPALLAAKSGASLRIGFENAGRGHYFHVVLPLDYETHMAENFLRPLESLGIQRTDRLPALEIPVLPPTLPAKHASQRRVGLHPGARHQTQRWHAAYFVDLARKISEEGDQVLILGPESERALVEEIADRSGGSVIPLLLREGILEFAATLKTLELLICNNSGPLHLAVLLGVPTLSFMGPTVKERWWPLGGRALVLRRDDLPCIGCNLAYCRVGTHACMGEITPQIAFEAYKSFRNSLAS